MLVLGSVPDFFQGVIYHFQSLMFYFLFVKFRGWKYLEHSGSFQMYPVVFSCIYLGSEVAQRTPKNRNKEIKKRTCMVRYTS